MIPKVIYEVAQKLLATSVDASACFNDEQLIVTLITVMQNKGATANVILVAHAVVARYEAQNPDNIENPVVT